MGFFDFRDQESEDARAQWDIHTLLLDAPPMEISDRDAWARAIVIRDELTGAQPAQCARGWAQLMQIEMGKGATLEEAAQSTSQVALEGVEPFMYALVVVILIRCWKYGEQFARWQNNSTHSLGGRSVRVTITFADRVDNGGCDD